MIVYQHLATLRKSRQRKDAANVTARHHPSTLHPSVRIDGANEADLASAGEPNRRTNRERGRGTQPSGWRRVDGRSHEFKSNSRTYPLFQVLSGFFFAAGNKTLLRISR